jgi:diguanylate cyclase (GGDEF)-like protein
VHVTSPRLATAIVVALLIVAREPAFALDDPAASSRSTLVVAAGFTGTPWFYALSAVSLVGAIAAAYRLRLLRAQAREAELIRLVEERTSQLQQANDHLQRLSYIDALTSIANRRHFEEILEIEWRRGFRAQTPMTLLMLDIDNFKQYNDAFGHRAGDGCLRRVAGTLDESVQRAGDLLARYGGEEFAAILTNTDEGGGAEVAERLRTAVENLRIHRRDDSAQVVTISVGVATGVPGEVASHEVLLAAADKALYEAKRAGRNRVGIAPARVLDDVMIQPGEPDPAI